MYSSSAYFQQAAVRGDAPVVVVFLETALGKYVYAPTYPEDREIGQPTGYTDFDGAAVFGGTWFFGGGSDLTNIIDRGAYIVSYDQELEETLAPISQDLISSLSRSEQTEFGITLDNANLHFSEILQADTFLAATLTIRFGFRGLPFDQFLPIFAGSVTRQELTRTTLAITAGK